MTCSVAPRNGIRLKYSKSRGASYEITIWQFVSEELPARLMGSSSVNYTVFGLPTATGIAYKAKFNWTVEAKVTKEEYQYLLLIWKAWHEDRMTGKAAKVEVRDQTLGTTEETGMIKGNAWFTEPPTASRLGRSGQMVVVFALAQV